MSVRMCVVAVLLTAIGVGGAGAQCVAPGLENFDAATVATGVVCGATSTGVLPTGWSLDPASTLAWHVFTGGTTSINTGPSADNTTGAGNYVYCETSCGTGTWVGILNAPCFDATTVTTPTVEFWYHMFGITMGSLDLQQQDPTGAWNTIWNQSGDQGDQWNLASVPVTPSSPQVALRLQYTRGTGFTGDCAIDDFRFGEPTPAEFQINQAESTLSLPGADGTSFAPGVIAACPGDPLSSIASSSDPTQGWEIGYVPEALIPRAQPAFVTNGGQVVNLNLQSAALQFMWGGTTPDLSNALTPWSGNPLNFNAPTAIGSHSFQMIVLAPSTLDGSALSQGIGIDVANAALTFPIAGPTTDDGNFTFDTGPAGVCSGPISFFGDSYTQFHVSSNGRVSFGTPDGDFDATVAEALADDPFVGFWTDLSPNVAGTIDITQPSAGLISVNWNGVPYFGEAATVISFSVVFDIATGTIFLDGLNGIVANPLTATTGSDVQFLGISRGGSLATDAGPSAFTVNGSGSPVASSDMLYELYDPATTPGVGLPPALLAGVNQIAFLPAGNTYAWSAF